jgi:hypothetical protein
MGARRFTKTLFVAELAGEDVLQMASVEAREQIRCSATLIEPIQI